MYTYLYKERIFQCDIFRDINVKLDFEMVEDELQVKTRHFRYAVVMTQDCDLEQDYNNRESKKENQRGYILSILLCPAFLEDEIKEGNHLKESGLTINSLNSGLMKPIKKNKDKRYYFLDEENVDVPYEGIRIVPNLVIDFKHYQTIPRDELYKLKKHYWASIDPLFREKVSDRFTHYLGRIGVPERNKDSCGYDCGKIL